MDIKPIRGECHCGKVSFSISAVPEKLVECNCSICRRLGALWGHVETRFVKIKGENTTTSYMFNEKTLAFHTCQHCGCTTHWENLSGKDDAPMAVNFRMCDPAVPGEFMIRKFDGADSWTFLD